MRTLAAGLVLVVGVACTAGEDPEDLNDPVVGACSGSAAVTSGLTSEGDLDVVCDASALAKLPATDVAKQEHIKISAPIWPAVLVLYEGEGEDYPATAEGRAKLAHDSAVTFAQLLDECPGLTRPRAGGPALTPDELADNYAAVEQCAYERYGAKPYWIPQLIADVDICKAELGNGWRRLTTDDLAGLGADARKAIAASLDFGGGGGGFNFSRRVFVIAKDGSVAGGDLSAAAAGAAPTPIDAPLRDHLEAGLALRCIHR